MNNLFKNFCKVNNVFEKQNNLFNDRTNQLVLGYVKLYNLIPIEDNEYGVFPTMEWKNPQDMIGNHKLENSTYTYSDIVEWIDEMEDFEIKQLEDAYAR
jgi:hypothetical protein